MEWNGDPSTPPSMMNLGEISNMAASIPSSLQMSSADLLLQQQQQQQQQQYQQPSSSSHHYFQPAYYQPQPSIYPPTSLYPTTIPQQQNYQSTTTSSISSRDEISDMYHLQHKARSLPSTRTFVANNNAEDDTNDSSGVDGMEKPVSWTGSREDMNYPTHNPGTAPQQAGMATRPTYAPRGSWAISQTQSSKSPSLLFTVQFKSTTDTFSLLPTCTTEVRVGDFVKVEGDRGLDIGVVSEIYSEIMDISFTKKILCLATQEEIHYSLSKEKDEVAAVELCRALVARRGLSICIVDAEFQCDRKKLTFFFTSDRHTDFRELVRDLFATFKTRIWMQKIKAPVGHAQPLQIRRPLPPTHPNPSFPNFDPNDMSYRQSNQSLYNVPRSLQSQAFMVSGADYSRPQVDQVVPNYPQQQVLEQSPEYQVQSNGYPQQLPSSNSIVPDASDSQGKSFVKSPVRKFRQIFNAPGQEEHVAEEYQHTGFGNHMQPYAVHYLPQAHPHIAYQHHYQGFQPNDFYHAAAALIQSNPPPLSLTQPDHYLSAGIPQQDTLSMFNMAQNPANHLPQYQMNSPPHSLTQMPPTVSQQDTLSMFNMTQNPATHIPQYQNIQSNLSLGQPEHYPHHQDTLSVFTMPQLPSTEQSSLSSHHASLSLPGSVEHPQEENLWLAKVAAQSSLESAAIPLTPFTLTSTTNSNPSSEGYEENHTPELLSLSNSLNDLSVSAEPFVYKQPDISPALN